MSDEKDKYIGYIEMSLGIGDMIGPAIGGIVFDLIGFVGAFISFGGMIFVGIIFCIFMIPESLNDPPESDDSSSEDTSEEDQSNEEPSLDEQKEHVKHLIKKALNSKDNPENGGEHNTTESSEFE